MQWRPFLLVCAIIFVFALSAPTLQAADAPAIPEPTGQAVADYITKVSPFETWGRMPGTTPFRAGKAPHGELQNVYVNDIAMQAINAGTLPMPDGSIIVKDNFNKDKQRMAITIMYKRAGYNPEGGDYFWLRLGPDMKPMVEGKLAACERCHIPAKSTDYLLLYPKK